MKVKCDECKKATSGEVGGCILEIDRDDSDIYPSLCPYDNSMIAKWECASENVELNAVKSEDRSESKDSFLNPTDVERRCLSDSDREDAAKIQQ